MSEKKSELRFDGSVWCNLDIALRNMDQYFREMIRPEGLTVIEWYVLRALYDRDGQHASELARAVGRAATSFTPNLDKLQKKGWIERRPDPSDRRAVRIYLTEHAINYRNDLLESAQNVDSVVSSKFNADEFKAFNRVLACLQAVSMD